MELFIVDVSSYDATLQEDPIYIGLNLGSLGAEMELAFIILRLFYSLISAKSFFMPVNSLVRLTIFAENDSYSCPPSRCTYFSISFCNSLLNESTPLMFYLFGELPCDSTSLNIRSLNDLFCRLLFFIGDAFYSTTNVCCLKLLSCLYSFFVMQMYELESNLHLFFHSASLF